MALRATAAAMSRPSSPPASAAGSARLEQAASLMDQVYGRATEDLDMGAWKPRRHRDTSGGRYLWTDAYGVCNYLSLSQASGSSDVRRRYRYMAGALVEDVHGTLGFLRDGSGRLPRATAEHPTAGGLRIGKPDDEDSPGAYEGDGQYLHYLTKWMFALDRMGRCNEEESDKYSGWAIDLAKAALQKFLIRDGRGDPVGMHWKMRIDLSSPLTTSEGHLDAFDALCTYKILQERAPEGMDLTEEIQDLEQLVAHRMVNFRPGHDPLDLGEAVWLASWHPEEAWARTLASGCIRHLEMLWSVREEPRLGHSFSTSTGSRGRLAFRELGTTIGVQAARQAPELVSGDRHGDNGALAEMLGRWDSRVDALHGYWSPRVHERDSDITPVMLCTSLLPGVMAPGGARP